MYPRNKQDLQVSSVVSSVDYVKDSDNSFTYDPFGTVLEGSVLPPTPPTAPTSKKAAKGRRGSVEVER
jgi:hypothetical protein